MANLKWIVPEPTTTEQLDAIDARHVHPVLRAMLDNREAWYELPPGASIDHSSSWTSVKEPNLDIVVIRLGIYLLPTVSRTTGDGRTWFRTAIQSEWDRLEAFMNANAED